MRTRWWIVVVGLLGLCWVSDSQADVRPPVKSKSKKKPTKERPAKRVVAKKKVAKLKPAARPVVGKKSGEAVYRQVMQAALPKSAQPNLYRQLRAASLVVNWKGAKELSFMGNLRWFKKKGENAKEEVYLVRKLSGELFVLALPKDLALLKKKAKSPYAGLKAMLRHKMKFKVQTSSYKVAGQSFAFARLVVKPKRSTLDRLFFIAIVALLFFVMVGMGLTLTLRDFGMVFSQPRGMLVGPLCQFGLLPFIAFLLGKAMGLSGSYPYIFAGMILVTASPGGVTSNLVTYLGRGDVALSVSLTALSTFLSIIFTPLLLTLYVSGIPQLEVPIVDIIKTIMVLVIVPLIVGMVIRSRAPVFAKNSEKFFTFLGIFALFFLIVVGVAGNLDKFADTSRYGVRFYSSIFLLTFLGMTLGGGIAKLLGVKNSQVRAIAVETGMQNTSLAMAMAILLQDRMGDFHSGMFFTAGIFGLWMYVASGLVIYLFPKVLPLEEGAKAA